MKSLPKNSLAVSFNRLLLITSMLFAPSMALAQGTPPPAEPTADVAQAPPQIPAFEDEFSESDEIVVLGRFIPEPMRETSEVAIFLSNEDLARQGDDNAASALTRLTGLSVVSGRFVFVRGLGDRYSSALLNGSPLPSPEPLRRTVPLDLFPSNILDGASVQKTFSPNYPGEFGGGIIDLRTLSQPPEPFFSLKLGGGYNSQITGRHGLIYHGSDTDWTSYDDGLRDIPGPLADAISSGLRIPGGFSDDEIEAIGESLVNSPLTVIQTQRTAPDVEVESSGGASWDIGAFNIGLIGVAGYDSAWTNRFARRGLVSGNSIIEDARSQTTTWDVTVNALGGLSLGWEENLIKLTGLYVHSSTKESQIQEGFDFNASGSQPCVVFGQCLDNRFVEATGWYERELANLQLSGDHTFGPLEINWRGAAARSTRDAPYERELQRLIPQSGGIPEYSESNRNFTNFSELTDEIVSGGVDLAYTIPLSDERDAVFSAGYAYSNTVRDYDLLQFLFTGAAGSLDVSQARADFLFSPDNIDPARFELIEISSAQGSYKGGLLVNAAYAAADVELFPLLRAALGVRWEDGRQTVRTFNRFGDIDPTIPSSTLIENEYFLPAATLTWNFAEDLQLRIGYSQTIARPQFRELAFSLYLDPDSDRDYRGNPSLIDSELESYDARLEYYFGQNQFITAGAFFKEIQSPIEEVLTEPSTGNFLTNFINAPTAILYGAELEFRTSFEMPFGTPWFADKTWLFSINYTYTYSEVQAGDGDLVIDPSDQIAKPASQFGLDGEPLQGTPENILNLQFGYEGEFDQLTLLLGWVDERILRRGLGAVPDVIEAPGITLDLVYRRNFTLGDRDFTLGLSARNLLNESHQEYQQSEDLGQVDFNSYDRGVSLSASLTAKF